MDAGGVSLLVGGILTGLAGLIGALAVLIRAWRPLGRAAQVARSLWDWLEGHDLADLVPRDMFTTSMTRDELRTAYQELETRKLAELVPEGLRRRVQKVIDAADGDKGESDD